MSTSPALTAPLVTQLLASCMYAEKPDPIPDDTVIVQGVMLRIGLDPKKLEEAKPKILELLQELPPSFFNTETGDSFLNMCMDRHGSQWGEHINMDELLVLGLAAGYIRMLPRQMWAACPGGLPLLMIFTAGDQKGMMTYGELRAAQAEGVGKAVEAEKSAIDPLIEELQAPKSAGAPPVAEEDVGQRLDTPISWTSRPWADQVPEDQRGGPHSIELVGSVEPTESTLPERSGDFIIRMQSGWSLLVSNPDKHPLPEVGETMYGFGRGNMWTTLAIGDRLYRAKSNEQARAESEAALAERVAAMEAQIPALEEAHAVATAGKFTLKDPADYQIGRDKNRDPYGACIYRYAEAWMALMEGRLVEGVDVDESLKEHADSDSHAADTEGITGFMYGAAGSIIARGWIHGEAFRRWYNIRNQIRDEGERANEVEGATLNPAVLTVG